MLVVCVHYDGNGGQILKAITLISTFQTTAHLWGNARGDFYLCLSIALMAQEMGSVCCLRYYWGCWIHSCQNCDLAEHESEPWSWWSWWRQPSMWELWPWNDLDQCFTEKWQTLLCVTCDLAMTFDCIRSGGILILLWCNGKLKVTQTLLNPVI